MMSKHLKCSYLFLTAFITVVSGFSPISAEVYKWTDEHGRIHYGDKPDSTDSVEINIKNKPVSSTSNSLSQEDSLLRQEKFLDYLQELRDDKKEASLENEIKTAEQRQKCEEARHYRDQLLNSPVLFLEGEDGSRDYLSEDQKAASLKEAEKYMKELC